VKGYKILIQALYSWLIIPFVFLNSRSVFQQKVKALGHEQNLK
tara:strand:- start:2198 stop:2326 length:129 start_codon:yes stop_codon:yes gene_type:complete